MMRDYIEWAISEAPIIEHEMRGVPNTKNRLLRNETFACITCGEEKSCNEFERTGGWECISCAAWRIAQARAEENFKEHMAKARAQARQKELDNFKKNHEESIAKIAQASAEISANGQFISASIIKQYHEKFGGTPSVKNAGRYQDFQDYLENN